MKIPTLSVLNILVAIAVGIIFYTVYLSLYTEHPQPILPIVDNSTQSVRPNLITRAERAYRELEDACSKSEIRKIFPDKKTNWASFSKNDLGSSIALFRITELECRETRVRHLTHAVEVLCSLFGYDGQPAGFLQKIDCRTKKEKLKQAQSELFQTKLSAQREIDAWKKESNTDE